MSKLKCYVYGAGIQGIEIAHRLCKNGHEILGFIDKLKCNQVISGIKVIDITELNGIEYDKIVIGSIIHKDSMVKTALMYKVDEKKIDTSYIDIPIGARKLFLESFSELTSNICAPVAELGVYKGNFSRELNQVFSDKIYLFDSFSGVDSKDLYYENSDINSIIKEGDMSDTSIEEVITSCPFRDNIVIIKGHFPDSVEKINDDIKFKFVYIDVDLYKPTLEGLMYFSKHLIENGCILVDDYFDYVFGNSIKRAVHEFISIQKINGENWTMLPIGYGTSISLNKR